MYPFELKYLETLYMLFKKKKELLKEQHRKEHKTIRQIKRNGAKLRRARILMD